METGDIYYCLVLWHEDQVMFGLLDDEYCIPFFTYVNESESYRDELDKNAIGIGLYEVVDTTDDLVKFSINLLHIVTGEDEFTGDIMDPCDFIARVMSEEEGDFSFFVEPMLKTAH